MLSVAIMNKISFSTKFLSQELNTAFDFIGFFSQFVTFPASLFRIGTVNILKLLNPANGSILAHLRKNFKAFPRAFSRGMFLLRILPVDVRLETSLNGLLDARGGKCPLLSFFTRLAACNSVPGAFNFSDLVIMTPVRYNGGQVYIFGQYYQQTPVIL